MSSFVFYENSIGHVYSPEILKKHETEASIAKRCTVLAIVCLVASLGLLSAGIFFVSGMPVQLTLISIAAVAVVGALIFSALALSFKKERSKNVDTCN